MVFAPHIGQGRTIAGKRGPTGQTGPEGPRGPEGLQGPPGIGTSPLAWAPSTAYTASQVVQAPDGSMLRRTSSGTSRPSFDATEAAAWTAVLEDPDTVEGQRLKAAFAAVVTPDMFGAVGNGVADDTAALQAAHDALSSTYGGLLWLPLGKRYNFTALNVTKPHVRIDGPGALHNGTVYVGVQAGYAPVEMWTFIRATFDRDSKSATADAIVIANSRHVDVDGCRFRNYRAGVSFPALSLGGTNEQHSARISVRHCRAPYATGTPTRALMDYLVYVNGNVTGGTFSVGDLTVCDNPAVTVNFNHIRAFGLDGLNCGDNIFFFPSWTQTHADKSENIYISGGSQINIHDNLLFEAGSDAIRLHQVQNFTVVGNTMTWPGQRAYGSGVRISGGGPGGGVFCLGTVLGNTVIKPTKAGVLIEDVSSIITAAPNTIVSPGDEEHFYGVVDTAVEHYGIYAAATTDSITAFGALVTGLPGSPAANKQVAVLGTNSVGSYAGGTGTATVFLGGIFTAANVSGDQFRYQGDTTRAIRWGTGTPEGVVTANVGSLYLRTDGGAGTTLYVKQSGTGNTGWAAK